MAVVSKGKVAREKILSFLAREDEAGMDDLLSYVVDGEFSISRSLMSSCLKSMVLCEELEMRKQSRNRVYRLISAAGSALPSTRKKPAFPVSENSLETAPDSIEVSIERLIQTKETAEAPYIETAPIPLTAPVRAAYVHPVDVIDLIETLPPPEPLPPLPPPKGKTFSSITTGSEQIDDQRSLGMDLERQIARAQSYIAAHDTEEKKKLEIAKKVEANRILLEELQRLQRIIDGLNGKK